MKTMKIRWTYLHLYYDDCKCCDFDYGNDDYDGDDDFGDLRINSNFYLTSKTYH
jgi:hypothetical protein